MTFRKGANGMWEYTMGIGILDDGDMAFVTCWEIDDDESTWAHIIRFKHKERVPGETFTMFKDEAE